ncbi:MAG: hypothetical protein ACLT1W_07335 [Alistipes onderdonkii]
MYTNIWEEPFEINEATTVLHVHFTFKPLMAASRFRSDWVRTKPPRKSSWRPTAT